MRTTLKLAACLGAALVLAGCGGEKPFSDALGKPKANQMAKPLTGPPHAVLLASVQRTTDTRSARVAMTIKVSGSDDGDFTMRATGLVDFTHDAGSLTLTDLSDPTARLSEARIKDDMLYVRDGGGPWIKQRVKHLETSSPSFDANEYLGYLHDIAENVQNAGPADLHGVPTTRFTANVNLQHVLDRMHIPAAERPQIEFAFGGKHPVWPVSAWIDGEGRVRQETESVKARFATLSASLEFSDYGVPVVVSVPSGARAAGAVVKVGAQDRATQSDLRNGLTVEKVVYTDNGAYSAGVPMLKSIESSLDWGGRLTVEVGDAVAPSDSDVVCLSEKSASGKTFAIADVAAGPYTGTYFGSTACPDVVTPVKVAALGTRW